MELDDLRRQWQQPAPAEAPPALDTAALTQLLARGSRNPVSRMRRNVWFEMGFMAVCLLGSLVVLPFTTEAFTQALLGWLIVLCVFSGFYYRRKLAVLRCLSDSSGALRDYVARQLASLRRLVQLYYQVTMWSLPVSFGIGLVFIAAKLMQKLEGQKLLLSMGILLGIYIAVGVLTFFGLRWFTRLYLQRLYGRHLDRLEASLHELRDEPTA
ncbi:hypothetical protein I2I05_04955 [Hymenobacter sp. BT683]|uniref:Uncharacterized protein n=1 Tax=Hymenobacter jeongseonensis TaxID=2791027 RepID=A0ABS0IEH3_9BACT|nr:hypothetical protein [Hymenobacter jeongseonensis]MBF9236737.1 hypothetical protein [Hymenobacter jeongseonensis]